MPIDSSSISIQDLKKQNVPQIVDYWFKSPPGFIESIGVDLTKLPTEKEMTDFLLKKIKENSLLRESKMNALIIHLDGQPIGFHTINPLVENDYGIFHAHIWDPKLRRRGIGMLSYPLACSTFIKRFNLKRILFKTPEMNTGSIRVKEKLGIRCIGNELVGFGIIRDLTPAKVFELTREEARERWRLC